MIGNADQSGLFSVLVLPLCCQLGWRQLGGTTDLVAVMAEHLETAVTSSRKQLQVPCVVGRDTKREAKGPDEQDIRQRQHQLRPRRQRALTD